MRSTPPDARRPGTAAPWPRLLLVLALALLAPRPAAATPEEAPVPTEEQRVLATEDEYVAAEVGRDEQALRKLVDDRFVFNTSKGTTTGKDELIRSVLAMNLAGQTIRERTVLVEGDIALVFGTAEMRFAVAGREDTVSLVRYTAAYVKRGGEWRMLALHMNQRAPQE